MFAVAMSFFSCNALKCVSKNNQGCKVRLVLKQVKLVVVVIISMNHMQNYVFLLMLKI